MTAGTIEAIQPLVKASCASAGDRRRKRRDRVISTEAATIGRRIGCTIEQTVEDRHAITAGLGAFRTSMLQDVQAERPIEPTPSSPRWPRSARGSVCTRARGLYPKAAAAAMDKT